MHTALAWWKAVISGLHEHVCSWCRQAMTPLQYCRLGFCQTVMSSVIYDKLHTPIDLIAQIIWDNNTAPIDDAALHSALVQAYWVTNSVCENTNSHIANACILACVSQWGVGSMAAHPPGLGERRRIIERRRPRMKRRVTIIPSGDSAS